MNVLFLGGFYPPRLLEKIREASRGKIGLSNHNFEMSIVNGLMKHDDVDLKIVTMPKVYSFPHNNKTLYTKAESYYLQDRVPVKSVGFVNLLFFNKVSMTISLICNLLRVVNSFRGKQIGVIVNTPNVFMASALFVAKFLSAKKVKTMLVIPDIPQMVSQMDKMSLLKKVAVSMLNRLSMRLAERYDTYVLLTSNMQDFFKKQLKFIVMEGIVNEDLQREERHRNRGDKDIILYTGTLRGVFGILNLVEAFERGAFRNTELWICGSGEASTIIREKAAKNPNIVFWGLVDSKKALELQDEATILVNPRTSAGVFTKYSFPSKTMEYLQSGKVVIANKLPGMPDEYFNYIVVPENESIEALTKAIQKVLDMSTEQRELIGGKGKIFVQSQKNSYVQTGRMLELMRSV